MTLMTDDDKQTTQSRDFKGLGPFRRSPQSFLFLKSPKFKINFKHLCFPVLRVNNNVLPFGGCLDLLVFW